MKAKKALQGEDGARQLVCAPENYSLIVQGVVYKKGTNKRDLI